MNTTGIGSCGAMASVCIRHLSDCCARLAQLTRKVPSRLTFIPRTCISVAAVVAALALGGASGHADGFDPKTSSFSIAFKGEVSAYYEMSALVLPETTLTIEAIDGPPGLYQLTASRGVVTPRGLQGWQWTAPATPGLVHLHIDGPPGSHAIELHAFVLVPASEEHDGVLNGYQIGRYPAPKGNPLYQAPVGFVEVTKDNQDEKVSPHFRLKQFVCKEDPPNRFPKYVVIKERLLLKLEAILEEVNRLGFDTDTLHIMSAYRTPFYNHAIGDVAYSMHQFGSAADIFVDQHNKGVMDDLTRDGHVDIDDSLFLQNSIENMLTVPAFRKFQGGMGYYPPTIAHPPFVHVDVRGVKARWKG